MVTKEKLTARQTAVLNHIRQQGRVLVDDLAEIFATTPQTIRKDLQILADANEVVRFHGGASLLSGVEYTSYEARKNIATRQKELIGAEVARRIPNHTALMINVGTTTAAVANALANHLDLKIITDNVNIANDLRKYPSIEIMVPGGVVRHSDGAIVGGAAVDFIRQFRADIAVIGASAIGGDGSLLDYDLREAHVARAIVENSRHVILAADATKYERTAPIRIGHLNQVDVFVTDQCSNDNLRALCDDANVELVEAGPNG
ncbi:MAG: DeoR/GlpR family DNA-binding transcription regulator [Pseudomonadota bacterium]